MQVSVKELRTQPGRIVSMAGLGNDIVITMRGKPAARIVPLDYPTSEGEKFLTGNTKHFHFIPGITLEAFAP